MKFSVIIPFAQNEGTINACLSSVCAAVDEFDRLHPDLGAEVICVNGGSRDGTRARIENAVARDSRIVAILDLPAEIGSGPARNRGLEVARGDYVMFVDADDTLLPEALVELCEATADIVTFLGPTGFYDLARPENVRKLFSPLVGNLLVWNAIYRRAAIGGWRFPNLRNHQDLVWTAGMFARARTVDAGAAVWYRYDPHVAGSAVNSHSWARVGAAWRATGGMARAVLPCLQRSSWRDRGVLGIIMFRKLAMHLLLHCFAEIPRALCGACQASSLARARLGSPEGAICWLIDARTFSTQPTGVGLYAYRHVCRLRRENPTIRFVLASDVIVSEEIQALVHEGVEVRAYGRRVFMSAGVWGYFRFLKRLARELRPDVFWQPNNLQPVRLRGVPRVIVTVHDVFGLEPFSWRHPLWPLYYRLCFARTLKNVSEIWFNSEDTAKRVRERKPTAVARTCRIVYPLTDVPQRETIEPYRHERPYFLYLGNVETRKGADLLFSAYREYREQESDPLDLIVAGLERDVHVPREPGLVPLGYVGEALKYSLMCSAAALVVPSRAEGYGMQFAEALALNVRVMASDLPVFREIDVNASPAVTYLRGFREGSDEERVGMIRCGLKGLVSIS